MQGITITVERGPGKDEYGDPIPGAASTHEVAHCAVMPRRGGGREVDDRGREGSIVGLTLHAPAGADLLRTDQVVIPAGTPNAGRYEVEGEAAEWVSPFTGRHFGFEVALRRAEG